MSSSIVSSGNKSNLGIFHFIFLFIHADWLTEVLPVSNTLYSFISNSNATLLLNFWLEHIKQAKHDLIEYHIKVNPWRSL